MYDCLIGGSSCKISSSNAFFSVLVHKIAANAQFIFIVDQHSATVSPYVLATAGGIIKALIKICGRFYRDGTMRNGSGILCIGALQQG